LVVVPLLLVPLLGGGSGGVDRDLMREAIED
jgi:hypothetical protein